MLEQSGAVESLVRLCGGRPIKIYGPTGKTTWHYPDASQVLWAIERILRKGLPDLSGITLSGEEGAAAIRMEGVQKDDKELARRLLYLAMKGEREPPRRCPLLHRNFRT